MVVSEGSEGKKEGKKERIDGRKVEAGRKVRRSFWAVMIGCAGRQ